MDADTRHQLKQNELAEALEKVKHLDRTTILLIIGAVALLIVFGGVRLMQWQTAESNKQAWSEFFWLDAQASGDRAALLAELRPIAAEGDARGGAAALRIASLLLGEAMEDPETGAAKAAEAAAALEPVVGTTQPAEILAPAHFLLAQANEWQEQWDRARQHYQALEDPRFAGSPLQQLAVDRLAGLEELATIELTFTPGTPEPITSTTQPGQVSAPPAPEVTPPVVAPAGGTAESTDAPPAIDTPETSAAEPATEPAAEPAAEDSGGTPAEPTPANATSD